MPRGVIYDTFTEAQEYADRVNGEPTAVEGGYMVTNPLGYVYGGTVDKEPWEKHKALTKKKRKAATKSKP